MMDSLKQLEEVIKNKAYHPRFPMEERNHTWTAEYKVVKLSDLFNEEKSGLLDVLKKSCMVLRQKQLEEVIELKANELGWILKLAENHYDSKQFREYIKKHNLEKLNRFLKLLILRFHPNHFYVGHPETIWILIKKEELLGVEKDTVRDMLDAEEKHRVKRLGLKQNKETPTK